MSDPDTAPPVLLAYQERLLEATRQSSVVVVEKSRRIGATWAIAADSVLTAGAQRSAGGMDVFYIGYNLDMTREFIDTCAFWSRHFLRAVVEVGEFMFKDQDKDGADREIQAFRIRFASGYEIVALCSRPRSLRGRQGYVIIDEAAFHDELPELLKAAFALLIWGGKVLVISTHDGADNAFNELVQEVRAGKKPYALLRTTFRDALDDGLYRRVCLSLGKQWSLAAEVAWEAEIRAIYGDAVEEELDCIPRKSGGKYLSRVLLEARAVDVPVLRWTVNDAFVDLTDEQRTAACLDWIKEQLDPVLATLPKDGRSYLGEDFGRSGDLTILWPLLLTLALQRRTPFIVELRNIPFREQETVLLYLCSKLPNITGIALDARGNGQYLAERARQAYGPETVAQVMLSEGWYREHMPRLKAALEDDKFDVPANAEVIEDFRAIEVVNGVPRVVERTGKKSDGTQRHGDGAIAGCLAMFASTTLEGGLGEWATEGKVAGEEAFGGPDPMDGRLGPEDLWS